MKVEEIKDEKGRKYAAHISPDIPAGAYIPIYPPEGLVDTLGLPEDMATRLHNILYDRKITSFKDISAKGVVQGIMQDLYSVDAQKLAEAFAKFEKETVGG